jgi:hypothetical protein
MRVLTCSPSVPTARKPSHARPPAMPKRLRARRGRGGRRVRAGPSAGAQHAARRRGFPPFAPSPLPLPPPHTPGQEGGHRIGRLRLPPLLGALLLLLRLRLLLRVGRGGRRGRGAGRLVAGLRAGRHGARAARRPGRGGRPRRPRRGGGARRGRGATCGGGHWRGRRCHGRARGRRGGRAARGARAWGGGGGAPGGAWPGRVGRRRGEFVTEQGPGRRGRGAIEAPGGSGGAKRGPPNPGPRPPPPFFLSTLRLGTRTHIHAPPRSRALRASNASKAAGTPPAP